MPVFDLFATSEVLRKNNTNERLPLNVLRHLPLWKETTADSECCSASCSIPPFRRAGLEGQGLSAVPATGRSVWGLAEEDVPTLSLEFSQEVT